MRAGAIKLAGLLYLDMFAVSMVFLALDTAGFFPSPV